MTDPYADRTVDQIYFGWSHEYNQHTVISSSLDVHGEGVWRKRLAKHVRLQPVGGGAAPARALSYLRFKDGDAIVCRFNKGYSQGRGNAHALLARSGKLTPELALRLATWTGWMDYSPSSRHLGPVSLDDLVNEATPAAVLTEGARAFEADLVHVVGRVLDNRDLPVSVIGCPDEYKVAVLWGMHAALEADPGRQRTFSTYETSHDATIENLPDIVFLPALPTSGFARRTLVDFNAPVPSSSEGHSRQLVERALNGVPVPQPVPPPVQAPVTVPMAEQRPQPPRPTPPASNGRVKDDRLGEAIARLLNPQTPQAFAAELDMLRRSYDPKAIREKVDAAELDRITGYIERTSTADMLGTLTEVLYGPGTADLSTANEARRHAKKMLAHCESGRFAETVMSAAGKGRGNSPRRSSSASTARTCPRRRGPARAEGPQAPLGRGRGRGAAARTGVRARHPRRQARPRGGGEPAHTDHARGLHHEHGRATAPPLRDRGVPQGPQRSHGLRVPVRQRAVLPAGQVRPGRARGSWRCTEADDFELRDSKATFVAAIVSHREADRLSELRPDQSAGEWRWGTQKNVNTD
ncbi:hypothetical protein ACFQV2_03720 [Actinokineospora soli]|uniref:Uncharacterized protein n=1 Tax=Actinokineospora soli TaxID=1048753 RepID=A0ABW2TIC7_9PSEU